MRLVDRIYRHHDMRAVVALGLLWLLFFWRLFTPVAADQASLAQGDFSGQFLAFAAYQYERFSAGEIPLWNPYNNGGLPFIADTQAAVFYPPRWLTLWLSQLAGGWSYNALQLEMAFHVLLYSLLMYAFVRRLTLRHEQSQLAALGSAIVIGYGGYLTGYPTLQLAILEAAVWLPLCAIGILEATRAGSLRPQYIGLAGLALGLSWLAGHPQTSFFLSYLAAAYFAWRCYGARVGWRAFLGGLLALILITIGLTAVTLLPGIEYLLLTSRGSLAFEAKGNGFPFRDLAQFVFPGAVSQWSPLYVGLPALFFVAVALLRRTREVYFWLLVAVVGLLHSLGANSPVYDLSYHLIPGLRFFRGQERAALLVANSLAILAGLGMVTAAHMPNQIYKRRALRYWSSFSVVMLIIAAVALFIWTYDAATWDNFFNIAARSALVCAVGYFLLRYFLREPGRWAIQLGLLALIAFELFSVNMDHSAVYDSKPAGEQVSIAAPPLVQQVLEDQNGGQPFRVDGFRGLGANYGSLYGVMDIRGISPLFLKGPSMIIHADYQDNPLAWELFAVRYVFSGEERLSVPSQVLGSGEDGAGLVYLHRLQDPRPFARLYYEADVVDSDEWALELMEDIRYQERDKIVVQQPIKLELPGQAADGTVEVLSFAAEEIVLEINTPENAILSVSLPHYPGWVAEMNGQPVEIMRAYAGLSAVELPAGRHTLTLRFAPRTYQLGGLISLLTWLGLAALALVTGWRR